MYINLRKLLRDKGISDSDFALVLGVAKKTAYNKLEGESDFYLQEARKVMVLFPEYTMEYIFRESEDVSPVEGKAV